MSLPIEKRKSYEIWYRPESPPYIDCFTISAPDMCKFFQSYWISGEPRNGNGYVYVYYGSLPGTTSIIRQRSDGINYAILINERNKISNNEIDKKINEYISKVKEISFSMYTSNWKYKLK